MRVNAGPSRAKQCQDWMFKLLSDSVDIETCCKD